MNINKREDFDSAVWKRVKELIREKDIKQSQLVRKCGENGMPITQPELSKLYNGTKKINLYELAAISKALEVPVDFFISDFISYRDDLLNSKASKKLLSSADNEEFDGYYGSYCIYYNATIEQSEKVQRGRMIISHAKEGHCKVELMIYTGTYKDKKEIVKEYVGCMLIATLLSGAYIVLRNDLIGELCFMIMRHQTFLTGQMECRMALCLTIGAGGNKLPTVHRMLISREEIPREHMQDIKPYLDLYGNVIRIEKDKARELCNALEKDEDRKDLEALWRQLPEKEYYEVSIELLRRYLRLDRKEFTLLIAKLLRLADTEPYSKIRHTDDSLTYDVVSQLIIATKGIPPDII